jgi:hypothetical protein
MATDFMIVKMNPRKHNHVEADFNPSCGDKGVAAGAGARGHHASAVGHSLALKATIKCQGIELVVPGARIILFLLTHVVNIGA